MSIRRWFDSSPRSLSRILVLLVLVVGSSESAADTVGLWLFDEHIGLYPSSILNDAGPNGYVLVLGRGATITEGKFGHGLVPSAPAPIKIINRWDSGQQKLFGLVPTECPEGRTVEPMTWDTASFAALCTRGEKHLRHMAFADVTNTRLNLGPFDWTVELWFQPTFQSGGPGVVLEIGEGPRGENDHVTRLELNADRAGFTFVNQPGGLRVNMPSNTRALSLTDRRWHHFAFVHDAANQQLRHYVDGVSQPLTERCVFKSLEVGDEAYFSVGRDGHWGQPLPGRLDELRISDNQVYKTGFDPPTSFSDTYSTRRPKLTLKAGLPLLFNKSSKSDQAVDLGNRKHVFIDDAFVAEMNAISFTVNPPRLAERMAEGIGGHLSLIEDDDGLIRLYYQGPNDSLAVMTSTDGVHWDRPDLGRGVFLGARNIVIREPASAGAVFIDPNAPPKQRWKYFSGLRGQAMFVFYSADGWSFERHEVAAVPFAAGSQSTVFYDDQRQLYVGYHRSDYGMTPQGGTQREFVLTEVTDLLRPWPFSPVSQERTREVARTKRIKAGLLDPWYLDNGPLAPGGIGIEYPTVFGPDPAVDSVAVDVYVPKAQKYPWAPDTYLAFPTLYFDYHGADRESRRTLGHKDRGRGSGTTEVQLAVSRDGLNWRRYPRPAYVGIGRQGGQDNHMTFMAQGMIHRGTEIWQYYLGSPNYHSAWKKQRGRALYRVVQRLDGFVSADGAYTGGMLKTRPLRFKGNRLVLNIDTDAAGYAQVGLLDEKGRPIPGYEVDDCVYINGDFIATQVEWLNQGKDLSSLADHTVQVVFRMRGTKLYAMQFVQSSE